MTRQVLMCQPTFFDVAYEINPWMHVANPVQPDLARRQWHALHAIYEQQLGWKVALLEPVQGLPDMVFTANGGLVMAGKVVLPQFRQPERQGETLHFRNWFLQHGLTDLVVLRHDFEGEGDALPWRDLLFAGYPWRTDMPAHRTLATALDVEVVSLQLTDARFYHLDTAFAVIDDQTVALYPAAFTPDSLQQIRQRVPRVIEASLEDACAYGLNSMSDGENVVISDRALGLMAQYRGLGKRVWPTPISEFQKSGGGVKCLTLELRH